MRVDTMTRWEAKHFNPLIAGRGWRDKEVAYFSVVWDVRVNFRFAHQALDRLAGLVVKASASGAEDPGFKSRLRRDFSGSSHSSDLKIGTPVATLLGAWRYRVSAGTGRPGVSILWLAEVDSLVCNFYLSVAARKIVWAGPSLRYTSMLLDVKQTTNQQTNPVSTLTEAAQTNIRVFPVVCQTKQLFTATCFYSHPLIEVAGDRSGP